MKKFKVNRKFFFNNFLNMFLLIIVLVMLVFSVLLVRRKLLQNTQSLGMALTKSYANEEETYITSLQNLMELGAEYMDGLYEERNEESIQQWLENYFTKVSSVLGDQIADPYAVIDGKIIAANPWEGDEAYNFENTIWYQEALEAEGEVVFTDVYKDAITGKSVITLAKELKKSGDVLVMDIFPEKMHEQYAMLDLPKECSFYLCDNSGNLIISLTPWDISETELQKNIRYLEKGIRNGSLSTYNASFRDYEGKKRGTYFHEMDNGWMVILTIPFESILMGEENMVVYVLAGAGVLLFMILFCMTLWNLLQTKRIQTSDNTIRILGESFYAIYLINFEKETYEFIKPSEEIARELQPKGNYKELLKIITEYVEPDICQEVANAFSLENIRERVRDNVLDYGGDYKRKFGDTYKWVNVRTLYNKKIEPDRVIFCFREVDMEKRQQQQHLDMLREALEVARNSAKEKELFFNNMSHDMRTPLNAIIGFSELIMESDGDWLKIKDYMEKIKHAGNQLMLLINDILELSRVQSGSISLKNCEFDIEKCIRESMDLFEESAIREKKHLIQDFSIQDKIVFGDSFKLEQILCNLLSNAFKYSNAGAQITVSVRQFISMNRSQYQIIVKDTGIGMSEEFLKNIFVPYSREIQFSSKVVIGTGLGMPIVKSLVKQLSGEITAESRLGEGSTFTVTLPLEVVNKNDQFRLKSVSDDGELADKKLEDKLKGCRILLAEDNILNMEIAMEILQMNGMEVIPASNGQEAVNIFQCSEKNSFDVILMDMQMPVMDGCEAARAIRSMERSDAKTIPIIAVTANAFAEDIEKTKNAGMNGHVSKPLNFKILVKTLEMLIEK